MSSNEHRWAIQVLTSYSWIEDLAETHNPVDVGFLTDTYDAQPNQYGLVSHHWDELNDHQAVADRAAALIALFDGTIYLQKGHFGGLKTGNIIDLRTGARYVYADGNVLADPFSADWMAAQIPRAYGDLKRPSARMLYMARTDDLTRGMLSFLGVNGPTWISLFALRDYMNNGGWDDDAIAVAANSTRSEVNRFRQTANTPAAVGPFARHGEQNYQAPKKIMTLDEAKAIILAAAGRFLDDRAQKLAISQVYQQNRA
ncbi:hypothetical protein [Sphingobium chungbukense]|uniref:Uncharacterized protein n=1 Tax=Sphingobium chungbukense TaxID=56193 RepID=A0A0M3AH42_9SPHN|nr:hypothetical protein [Sphingobium chungbukense]KKW89402.1 hypothetical protein YP76_25325 [Sphingobium chungbukense]